MARARNIKPGFFKNEDLAECSAFARLCFAGMWTLADREGRLEDRPKRIKGELFAFDSIEVESLLQELERHRFILRYRDDAGLGIIQVLEFRKHQTPHFKEAESVLASPQSLGLLPDASTQSPRLNADSRTAKTKASPGFEDQESHFNGGRIPPDSLIPDSLIPDTGFLIPDSSTPDGVGAESANSAAARVPGATAPATRGARLTADWKLPKAWGDWALAEYAQWGADKVRLEGEKFRDHWVAKTGKDATKTDWLATWRNWCRSPIAHQDDPKTPAPPPPASARAARHAEVRAALGISNDDQEVIDAQH